jgi:hypothetical protein
MFQMMLTAAKCSAERDEREQAEQKDLAAVVRR